MIPNLKHRATCHKIFDSYKLLHKDFRALSVPNLIGQPFFFILNKRFFFFISNTFGLISVNKLCSVLEISGKIALGANPLTLFRGRITKKLWLHIVKHMIYSIFSSILHFKYFVHFEILSKFLASTNPKFRNRGANNYHV